MCRKVRQKSLAIDARAKLVFLTIANRSRGSGTWFGIVGIFQSTQLRIDRLFHQEGRHWCGPDSCLCFGSHFLPQQASHFILLRKTINFLLVNLKIHQLFAYDNCINYQ